MVSGGFIGGLCVLVDRIGAVGPFVGKCAVIRVDGCCGGQCDGLSVTDGGVLEGLERHGRGEDVHSHRVVSAEGAVTDLGGHDDAVLCFGSSRVDLECVTAGTGVPCIGSLGALVAVGFNLRTERDFAAGADGCVGHRSELYHWCVHIDDDRVVCLDWASVIRNCTNGGGDFEVNLDGVGHLDSSGGFIIGFERSLSREFVRIAPLIGERSFVAGNVGSQLNFGLVVDGGTDDLVAHLGKGYARGVHVHRNGVVSGGGAGTDSGGHCHHVDGGVVNVLCNIAGVFRLIDLGESAIGLYIPLV